MRRFLSGNIVLLALLAAALAGFSWGIVERVNLSRQNCQADNITRQEVVALATQLVDAKTPGLERERLRVILRDRSKPGGPLGIRKC